MGIVHIPFYCSYTSRTEDVFLIFGSPHPPTRSMTSCCARPRQDRKGWAFLPSPPVFRVFLEPKACFFFFRSPHPQHASMTSRCARFRKQKRTVALSIPFYFRISLELKTRSTSSVLPIPQPEASPHVAPAPEKSDSKLQSLSPGDLRGKGRGQVVMLRRPPQNKSGWAFFPS